MPRLDKSRTGIERDIAPPMKFAVTIPVRVDDMDAGVVIYIAISPFGVPTDNYRECLNLMREVVDRLELKTEN